MRTKAAKKCEQVMLKLPPKISFDFFSMDYSWLSEGQAKQLEMESQVTWNFSWNQKLFRLSRQKSSHHF